MSEVRSDGPDEIPPESREPRYGRGYGGDGDSAWAWWWWILGIVIIGLIIWWIVAAATPGYRGQTATRPGQTTTGGTVSGGIASPQAVLSNPNRYLGQAVSARGVVGHVLGTSGFVLQSSSTARQGLLVTGRSQLIESLQPGQSVEVTGTVQRFSSANLPSGANKQQFQSYANQPALQAASITNVSPPPGQPSGGGTGY